MFQVYNVPMVFSSSLTLPTYVFRVATCYTFQIMGPFFLLVLKLSQLNFRFQGLTLG